jgi:transcription elongation factor Elf1
MGLPPMLNGQSKKLKETDTFTCPACGRDFNSYEVHNCILRGEWSATKKCPICHETIKIRDVAESTVSEHKK